MSPPPDRRAAQSYQTFGAASFANSRVACLCAAQGKSDIDFAVRSGMLYSLGLSLEMSATKHD
jgi:hypothetical protein